MMSDKFSIEEILKFASKDETRIPLSEPKIQNDELLVTDGRILLRIPLCEIDLGGWARKVPGKFPDWEKHLGHFFKADWAVITNPDLKEDTPESMLSACMVCAGSGRCKGFCACCGTEAEHSCGNCLGLGNYEDDGKWRVQMWEGGPDCSGFRIYRISQLPQVSFYRIKVAQSDAVPVGFKFGRNALVILMPLRSRCPENESN